MFDILRTIFEELIEHTQHNHYRYLYDHLDINNRLTGIIGARGVGKTTLMLQTIKNKLYSTHNAFYFSADHIYFTQTTIYEVVLSLHQNDGIEHFFIDEIHKYANWSQELKNIYDSHPNIKIVFSGSSSINLISESYDLSRRASMLTLHGMSFREYLNFKTDSHVLAIGLKELLNPTSALTREISKFPKLKGHFSQYLKTGFYPFSLEENIDYYQKVVRTAEKAIYEDIAEHFNLKTENLAILKKMLVFLASIPPGEINPNSLAKNLSIDPKTCAHYCQVLNDTGLARIIYPEEGGNQLLRKPIKVFINNTTMLYAFNTLTGEQANIGNVRELFFLQMLNSAGIPIFYSKQGDYNTHDNCFEIGGKSKTRKQIKQATKPAYLVKDNILIGGTNEIPLHMLGFLY